MPDINSSEESICIKSYKYKNFEFNASVQNNLTYMIINWRKLNEN